MSEQQSRIDIIITTIKKGLGDKETKTTLKEMGKGFQQLTGVSLGWASVAGFATAAAVKLVQRLQEAERAAVDDAKADAKLQAVLTSTGGAAGITAGQLKALSREISTTAGLEDSLVTSAEAVLLTFTKVNSTVFPKTMKAAADMSAVLGTDLQGAVTQIGKAMNDFSGYAALKKSGVSFTEEQIKQIANFKESNDLIGYQNLVLSELETEFSGAAKAINDAGDGSENLNVSADNLNAAMGREFLPIAKAWNKFWTDYNNNLADSINSSYDYNQTVKDLGISIVGAYGSGGNAYKKYFLDGHEISLAEVQDRVNQKRANDAWGASLTAQAKALGFLGSAAVQTDEEIAAMNAELLKTATAETDWETNFTNAKDATGQFDLTLQMLRTGLQAMGPEGEEVFQAYLLGINKIEPAAVEAMIRTKAIIAEVNAMLARGASYTVIVSFLNQVQGGGNNYTDTSGNVVDLSSVPAGTGSSSNLPAGARQNGVNGYYDDKGVWHGWTVRAAGGPVSAGMVAMVGEKGPEPVVFGQDGFVFPTGTNLGNNVVINVNGAGDPRAVANEVMHQLRLQGVTR